MFDKFNTIRFRIRNKLLSEVTIMNKSPYGSLNKKKTSKKRTVLKVALLISLLAFISVLGYGFYLENKANKAADRAFESLNDRTKSQLRDEAVEPLKDNVSILFIGVDESDKRKDDGNSRSDALLVATLNNDQKTVNLLSIPRDANVYDPNRQRFDKITHAHAFGGTEATIDTVENLLEIPIDYYVKMNFNAFIEVVDAIGGVTVDVPYDHVELDENDKRSIELEKGEQHLDGRHTLALARTRKLDSDVDRGKRQQMILNAIAKESLSLNSFVKLGDVIDAVGNNMKTNMTYSEMKSFLEYAKGGIPDINMMNIEGDDNWTARGYYWELDETDLAEKKELLMQHLELTPDTNELTDDEDQSNTNTYTSEESTTEDHE